MSASHYRSCSPPLPASSTTHNCSPESPRSAWSASPSSLGTSTLSSHPPRSAIRSQPRGAVLGQRRQRVTHGVVTLGAERVPPGVLDRAARGQDAVAGGLSALAGPDQLRPPIVGIRLGRHVPSLLEPLDELTQRLLRH